MEGKRRTGFRTWIFDRAFQILYSLIFPPLDTLLRKELRNRVAWLAVACHLALLSVQKRFIAVDTDNRTTTMQRSSQTIRSAECEQLDCSWWCQNFNIPLKKIQICFSCRLFLVVYADSSKSYTSSLLIFFSCFWASDRRPERTAWRLASYYGKGKEM
jgi:hypothetical protein